MTRRNPPDPDRYLRGYMKRGHFLVVVPNQPKKSFGFKLGDLVDRERARREAIAYRDLMVAERAARLV